MNKLVECLGPIISDDKLMENLSIYPTYRNNVVSKSERIVALLDIYKLFVPNEETLDIYHQIYLSTLASLEKKDSVDEIKLLNENFKIIKGLKRYGIIGGLEAFRITGPSGIGKSTTIQRCVDLISHGKVIKKEKPLREVIPVLIVECVADGSFKSLLYSILQAVDSQLNTTFFVSNKHQTTTIDMLLSAVSNVLINHVALLIIDESERVANDSKKGEILINYLTQLVNQSNISICFVGNDTCNNYFQNKDYLARRTVGISMHAMSYGAEFFDFLKKVFDYQYVLNKIKLNSEIVNEFYNLSNGFPSIVISLFVETQKSAILSGTEKITLELLRKTFNSRFSNILPFVSKKRIEYPHITNQYCEDSKAIYGFKENVFKTTLLSSDKKIDDFVEKIRRVVKVELVKI